MGAVTIPATSPCFAISTARSIARPASCPAHDGSSPERHAPTDSCTSTSTPAGPTRMRSAALVARASRSVLATISGPIPRGSPRVTARRGRPVTSAPLGWRGRRRVQPDGDVHLLPQSVEEAANGAFLHQLLANALAKIGEGVLAARIHHEQLRHHELWMPGKAGDLEGHDVVRLLPGERLAIGGWQPRVRRNRREDARLLTARVVVMSPGERIEGHAVRPLPGDAVCFHPRARHVGGIDLRTDEDVARLHFARLDPVDPDDVEPVDGLDDRAHGSRAKREHPALELRHHAPAAIPAEVTALLARSRIRRLAPCDALELGADANLGKERLGADARDLPRGGIRLRRDDDLSKRHRRGTSRQAGTGTVEGFLDLRLGHVHGRNPSLLPELVDGAPLQLIAPHLVYQEPAVLLGRAEPRPLQLRAELRVARESAANLAELLIDGSCQLGVRDFDLELFGLLHQQLLIDQLADDLARDAVELLCVLRRLKPRLLLQLKHPLLHVVLRDRLNADHGDDAIQLNDGVLPNGGRHGCGLLSAEAGRNGDQHEDRRLHDRHTRTPRGKVLLRAALLQLCPAGHPAAASAGSEEEPATAAAMQRARNPPTRASGARARPLDPLPRYKYATRISRRAATEWAGAPTAAAPVPPSSGP